MIASRRQHVKLEQRRVSVVRALIAELAGAAEPTRIAPLIDQLRTLEWLLGRARRRRALIWAVRGVALVLIVLFALSRIPLRSTNVNLNAKAAGLAVVTGERSENLFPRSPALTRAEVVTGDSASCTTTIQGPSHGACLRVDDLRLNSLALHKGASVTLDVHAGCAVLTLVTGGGDLALTAQRAADGAVTAGTRTMHTELVPPATVQLCPEADAEIRFPEPSRVLVAHRIALGNANDLVTPSIDEGTIANGDTDQVVAVGRGDVVALGPLSEGLVVVRVANPLAVAVVGTVSSGSLSSGTGSPERTIMPSWLDWLWQSRAVRFALGVIGAVIAFGTGVRDRVLAELET